MVELQNILRALVVFILISRIAFFFVKVDLQHFLKYFGTEKLIRIENASYILFCKQKWFSNNYLKNSWERGALT